MSNLLYIMNHNIRVVKDKGKRKWKWLQKTKNSKQNKQKNSKQMKKGYFKKNHNGQNRKKNNIHAANFSLEDVDVKLT